jgi:hypothetical protein
MTQPQDLSVPVDAVPAVGLIRPAIEAVLAGRPWAPGPEATIAQAVAKTVSSPPKAGEAR